MSGKATTGGFDDQATALCEQILTGLLFELAPYRVRPLHERRVAHPLPDRLAGDPGVTVGRPQDVRRRVAVDPHGTNTAPGQLVERCRPCGPQADDGNVVRAHSPQPTTLRS